jgi:acetylornithine/succinyldiaminopimelate/putrescine aminotransferase/predicted amino acid dehydrogenase
MNPLAIQKSRSQDPRRPDPSRPKLVAGREPAAADLYGTYCRPKLADLLKSMRLDAAYHKASGNYVHYREGSGEDSESIEVLDLVSGFGACLLGHNHPELKQVLIERLEQDTPMLTQCAARAGAAGLAERLNRLIPAEGKYLCNFTNSGAESVEAALKHAYKVRFDNVRRTFERISRQIHDLFSKIEQENLPVELPDADKEPSKFRDDLDEINLAQFESFRQAPVAIALKGSFHGKTSAALKVTFNKSYREGYEGLSAIRTVFVDPKDVERLGEIAAEQSIEFLVPRIDGERVVLDRMPMTKAIALVFEVIMGEGGIRVLPEETLETLARIHPTAGVPYIIDEVQTGCGRTGAIFGYSQTSLARIEPEYVTLSKALGGGLVKIGTAMIHERVYDPDFGILHTSTFSEDDLSCAVACRVLDILTRNDGGLLGEIRSKGADLIVRLQDLQRKYPRVIREVRGRGLMIGIEFGQLEHLSAFFRYAGRQGFLSLLVTSYLLHHHCIRVLAPLTNLLKGNPGKQRQSILRIQPPAGITPEEIDRAVAALDEVLNIIDSNNEYLLVAHLIGEHPDHEARRSPARTPVTRPLPERREDFDARVGFILHPAELDHVLECYLPSFCSNPWDRGRLAQWWTGLARFLEPDVVHVEYIESDGFIVEVNIIAVPLLPEYMGWYYAAAKKGRDCDRGSRLRLREIQDKIQDAVTVARELGDDRVPTSMVGLGAFTSIVTDQGASINDYEVPVTTGNAYTTALMLESIQKAAEIRGLDLAQATCAVVGAAGNIGSVLAERLAGRCRHVRLIGRSRDDGRARLERVAARLREAGAECSVHTDVESARDCDVVAVATNSTNGRLITPEGVKPGAIVCSASVPSDLSDAFSKHMQDYLVFDGGFARLPEGNAIEWIGLPKDGLAFGCLSETVLLGFDGHNRTFAKGPLTAEQVRHTLELAEIYGFSLGEFKLAQKVHPHQRSES